MHKILIFSLVLFYSYTLSGQPEVDTIINGVSYYKKRQYTLTRTSVPPAIDGKLDDKCWSEGKWESNFTQYSPTEGAKVSQQTDFKIRYDYNNIYIGAKCFDSEPEKMDQDFSSRDIFSGDMIGFAFDSFFDKKSGYEFVMTSAGQRIDLKHIGDYKWDFNWNGVWDGAVTLIDSGWFCEMKIPLSQLRYIDKPQQEWGMHVWRWVRRNSEESHWQLLPRNSPAIVDQFGIIDGISNIKAPRQVEISPYGSVKFIPGNELTRAGTGGSNPVKLGYGIDTKIGIASNMILDLTINPDFGQVEADPSELNLTSYETFFEEKRPFFLESSDLFDFKLADAQMFYSRRIGQAPQYNPEVFDGESINRPERSVILGAAKLTGKTGDGLSVGIIESVVNLERVSVFSQDTSYRLTVNPYTNYLVGRIRKEINKTQTIAGGMITGTNRFITDNFLEEQLNRSSYSGGFDLIQYFKRKTYFIEGKTIFSSVRGSEQSISYVGNQNVHRFQRPDATYLKLDSSAQTLSGTGGELKIGKQGGQWRYTLGGAWFSPNLELNDVGYLRQSDLINENLSLEYVINKPKGLFLNYSIMMDQDASWTFGNELINSKIRLTLKSKFKNFWSINTHLTRNFTYLDPRILRGGPALTSIPFWTYFCSISTSSAKDLSITGSYQIRRNEDDHYTFSQLSANLKWLPFKRMRLTGIMNYTQNRLDQQYILGKKNDLQNLYLFGSLNQNILEFTFRTALYVTPEFSVEYYGSPYLSVGDYSNFRKVNDSHSMDYDDRYRKYGENELDYSENDSRYFINDADFGTFNFINPDFNFAEFRSNLILKWEYHLGSVIYLVWTHNRTYDQKISNMSQSDNFKSLTDMAGNNVFMIKFNYWFTI